MQLPLFPDHVDYSAVPTGIIPAWWLLQSGTVKALMRDLKSLLSGGALRHRRYVVELVKLHNDELCFFVMDRKRQIIAKCSAGVSTDYHDDHADRFVKRTEMLNRCYRVLSYWMVTHGVTRSNCVPVIANFEVNDIRTTHKVYRDAPELRQLYAKIA